MAPPAAQQIAAFERENARVDRNPTEPQKEAGNYQKGHLRIHGLDISIETPYGGERSGKNGDGTPWRVTLPNSYGYIRRTEGADGEQVDVIVGPHHDSPLAFVVDQCRQNGAWDEHKCFVGFHHPSDVAVAYDGMFSDGSGPQRRRAIHRFSIPGFKAWLRAGDTTQPIGKAVLAQGIGLASGLLRKWNEADHPRAPAGSAAGGEFTAVGQKTTLGRQIKELRAIAAKEAREHAVSVDRHRIVSGHEIGELNSVEPPRTFAQPHSYEFHTHVAGDFSPPSPGDFTNMFINTSGRRVNTVVSGSGSVFHYASPKISPIRIAKVFKRAIDEHVAGALTADDYYNLATGGVPTNATRQKVGAASHGYLQGLQEGGAIHYRARLSAADKALLEPYREVIEGMRHRGRFEAQVLAAMKAPLTLRLAEAGLRARNWLRFLRKANEIADEVLSKAFDESKHPRVPAGQHGGGKFAPKGGATRQSFWQRALGNEITPEALAVGTLAGAVGGTVVGHALHGLRLRGNLAREMAAVRGGFGGLQLRPGKALAFMRGMARSPLEHGLAIRRTGKLYGFETGTRWRVNVPIGARVPGAMSFHTHPDTRSFAPPSAGDVGNKVRGRAGNIDTVVSAAGSVFHYANRGKVTGAALLAGEENVFRHIFNEPLRQAHKASDVESLIISTAKAMPDIATRMRFVRSAMRYGAPNTVLRVHGPIAHGYKQGLADAGVLHYRYRLTPHDKYEVKHWAGLVDVARKAGRADAQRLLASPLERAKAAAGRVSRAVDWLTFLGKAEALGGELLAKAAASPQNAATLLAAKLARAFIWMWQGAAPLVTAATGPKGMAQAFPADEAHRHLSDALSALDPVYHAAVKKAVQRFSQPLLRKLAKARQPYTIQVDFDALNAGVVDFFDNYKMDLIQQITDDQRAAIEQIVADGVQNGLPPADIARNLRDGLGLTAYQAQNVINFRNELSNINDPGMAQSALSRQLRDARYDRSIMNAVSSGNDLSNEQIDAMVDAYKRRYIAYRATTIARTEALRAADMGGAASAQALIDSGQLPSGYDIQKTWIATNDSRTRPTHRDLNGKTVIGMDTPFVTSTGERILYPHDPAASAAMTVNCRCSLAIDIVPAE